MQGFRAPLEDLGFLVNELVDLDRIGRDQEVGVDLARAVWEEAGRFAEEVLAPLDSQGDRQGLTLKDGRVTTPDGFKEAYTQLTENGWNAVAMPEEFGGQELPLIISSAIVEMFSGANKAFNMCAGLTLGAVEALHHAASDELKATYLPKMVSGQWTGTMNLTEPQSGSDLSNLKTRALPQEDGTYLIKGQKIFISFGEHDLAENIIHLVLARTPDAPAGVRGISLFLVPKYLVNEDGSLGEANDLTCSAIEHKIGIHASPTCVMSYGENQGARGYLVGELNAGLMAMFVMMNSARLSVGLEGVASAEAAYQKARDYAFERVQGVQDADPSQSAVLADHADVQRMLVMMQSQIRAMRSMAFVIAEAQDILSRSKDNDERKRASDFLNLMTPIFKAWATESGVEMASLGIQIHGGYGYVEETGAAQIWRDSRISPIYEGTTGIQANDLVGRKLIKDGGKVITAQIAQMRETCEQLNQQPELAVLGARLGQALDRLAASVDGFVANGQFSTKEKFVAVPFLMACANTMGAWLLCRAALKAQKKLGGEEYGDQLLNSWIQSARFFCDYRLSEVGALCETVNLYLKSSDLPVDKNLL